MLCGIEVCPGHSLSLSLPSWAFWMTNMWSSCTRQETPAYLEDGFKFWASIAWNTTKPMHKSTWWTQTNILHTHTHTCIVLIRFCIFRNQKMDTPLYSWFLFSCFSAQIPNQLWIALELKEAGSQPSLLPTVPQSRRWSAMLSSLLLDFTSPSPSCATCYSQSYIILLFLHPKWFRILFQPTENGKFAAEAPQ